MRRWFLVFMALVVFAQVSSAAAALCCVDELKQVTVQHEQDAEAHATVLTDDAQHACELGHCHCHHASVACSSVSMVDVEAPAPALPTAAPSDPGKSHIPSGLDRPNWLRV